MKTRIAVGCGMLLTLGTAAAGTWIYEQGKSVTSVSDTVVAEPMHDQEVTPAMIAMWKATASSSDYIAPRVPI